MSLLGEPTPRPGPTTLTRVSWPCPGCGAVHFRVEPRVDALETADDLLRAGLDCVVLEDATVAEMRDADLAERAATVFVAPPTWVHEIAALFNPSRYRKN